MQLKFVIFYVITLTFSNEAKSCDYSFCNYEGECVLDTSNEPKCNCFGKTFFKGEKCTEPIDNCQPNPCANGGECHAAIGIFYCQCPPNNGGQKCERDKDTFTGLYLHYNRMAELGEEQIFLITFKTLGNINMLMEFYANDYKIDALIYRKDSAVHKEFKYSNDLFGLARKYGLRHSKKMPYEKGFYHISKGTFWQTGTKQLKLPIVDDTGNPLYVYDNIDLHVYTPGGLNCSPEIEILNCNRVRPLLHIDVTQYNVMTPIVKKRCRKHSKIFYKWTLMDSLGIVKLHEFGQSETSLFKIKPYDMSFTYVDEYALEYMIRVDITEEHGEKSFKSVARCYIETDTKPVKSIIIGGPSREVGAQEFFILDGSQSRDYFFAPNGEQHLKYQWSCRSTYDNNYCNTLKSSDMKITIDARRLKLSNSYIFSLKVSSAVNDEGVNASEQHVKVVDGSPFYIDILCVRNCAKDQYVAAHLVHLKAACLNCPKSGAALTYKWTLNANVPNGIDADKIRFIFTPGEGDMQSNVQLQITQGNRKGSIQLKLNKNEPPTSGRCTIAPTSGKEYETEFELNCRDYKDVDLPLWYEYTTEQLKVERCRNPSLKLRLPATSAVQIKVCDAYKACTTTNVAVQVSAMEVPQDLKAMQLLLEKSETHLRQLIRDGDIRNAMVLTSVILKRASGLETAELLLNNLNKLELLTLLEAEQFTTITFDLLKALKPLDNKKAALLARFFKKMAIGYRNILRDGEVRELQDGQYKLLTNELIESLSEFTEQLEEMQEVHTMTVQQQTDELLAEKYPDWNKFDVTVLPRIENWLQAAIELNECIQFLGHMATNMHDPAEEGLLVEHNGLSMQIFSFEDTAQRKVSSRDDLATVQINKDAIGELKKQLKSDQLLLQVISTTKNPYWWYPDEQPLSTGVLYFNIFSKQRQTEASTNSEYDLKNSFKLSIRLEGTEQKPNKLLKGYLENSLDMPIFETVLPKNGMLVVEFQSTSIDLKVMLRVGTRPRGYMVKKSKTLIKANSKQNQSIVLVNDQTQQSMGYMAVLAASDNIGKRAEFTFTTILRECLSWNFLAADPEWTTNGCTPIEVVNNTLHCRCHHLSTFAGKMAPVTIQPALGERQLHEHMPINWRIVIFYLVLLCILGFLLGRAYLELMGNSHDRLMVEIDDKVKGDKFDIMVYFHTGGQWNAGTTANLRLGLATHHQGFRTFIIYQNSANINLTPSSTCYVHLPITGDELLDDPMRISISHDGEGRYQSWYCNTIELINVKLQKSYYFNVRQWISTEPLTIDSTSMDTISKISKIRLNVENLFINWFGFQAFTGPWRCGTNEQLNRSERTMIWIIKITIIICIVACYFGSTTLETYEEEREMYYSFNSNIVELLLLSFVCFCVGLLVQTILIRYVLKY